MKRIIITLYYKLSKICFDFFKIRFFELEPARGIGHQGSEPACYIIEKKLGLTPYRMIYFFSSDPNIKDCLHNMELMKYWKKYFLFFLFENSNSLIEKIKFKIFQPLVRPERFNLKQRKEDLVTIPWDYLGIEDHYQKIFALRGWYHHQLLNLSYSDRKFGENTLQKLGVPKGAWFVSFHARDSAFYTNFNSKPMYEYEIANQSIREAPVESYYLAFKRIIEKGGWCIRTGCSKVAPLPKEIMDLGQVIDYPKSLHVSDKMDIFLLAETLFFLGCSSGPALVPINFGKRTVMTQTAQYWGCPPHHGDIFLFKRYYSKKLSRFLTIKEMTQPPYSTLRRTPEYEAAQIIPIDNTAEEILEAVDEMFDVLENKSSYTSEDYDLQTKVRNAMVYSPSYPLASNVGREFLRKHKKEFFPESFELSQNMNAIAQAKEKLSSQLI